jgi:hypothetical protein
MGGVMDKYNDGAPSNFIKSSEFEGKGLILKVVGVEPIKANNPDYGATDKDWLCQKEILNEGETFRYTFLDESGQERIYNTKSAVFFISFKNLNPEVDSRIIIKRIGKGRETEYHINLAPIEEL